MALAWKSAAAFRRIDWSRAGTLESTRRLAAYDEMLGGGCFDAEPANRASQDGARWTEFSGSPLSSRAGREECGEGVVLRPPARQLTLALGGNEHSSSEPQLKDTLDMTISIRRAEPTDYEAIRQIFAGPQVVWGTLQLPFPSGETWRRRLADPPEGIFSLVACTDHEVIGQLDLHTFPLRPRRRHVAQIGMAVRDDWQGKGVGAALLQAAVDVADKWLNLRRLELEVFTDNKPALRLYKRFGFVIEGTLAQFAYRDGDYVDVHVMARLKRESK
jgi:putative acetyltransferase